MVFKGVLQTRHRMLESTMEILDGRNTAKKLQDQIKSRIETGLNKGKPAPRLDMIIVGENFASEKYVGMKEKKAAEIGIKSEIHRLPEDVDEEVLIGKIDELNLNEEVTGFMVQLPLPSHLDQDKILNSIDSCKDVDGLTAYNLGKLFQGDKDAIAAATSRGIELLFDEYGIDVEGKDVVIIGRSRIVGLPIAAIMNRRNATVTVTHSKTKDLKTKCLNADVIISAVGKIGLVTEDMVKDGAVVIDVGINEGDSGQLTGDVDCASVADKCSYITPVPGGVGPMTITGLLMNTFEVWGK